MRYHDNGGSFLIQFRQQVHYFRTILGVQITGRLIGKDNLRISHYRTGNGHTLLLTAGKLLREVFGTVADIHPFQDVFYHAAAFGRFDTKIGQRKFYILEDIQFVYQVKTLKHKAQFAFADAGTFLFFQSGNFFSQ